MRLTATVPKDGPPRVQCDVNQQVIKMRRVVEECAEDQMQHEGKLYSSKPTDRVMAEVTS